MNEVQQIQEHHREVLRMAASGFDIPAIAESLKWPEENVRDLVKSDLGRKEVARLNRILESKHINIREQVHASAAYGAILLDELLEDDETPLNTRVRIAQDILDRAGIVKPTQVQGQQLHVHVTGKELARIRKEAIEEAEFFEVRDSPKDADTERGVQE